MVAVSHHFDEELDPDPRQRERSELNPHRSKNSGPDPPQSEKRIQIFIKMMRISNTSFIFSSKALFLGIFNPDLVLDPGESYPVDNSHGFWRKSVKKFKLWQINNL